MPQEAKRALIDFINHFRANALALDTSTVAAWVRLFGVDDLITAREIAVKLLKPARSEWREFDSQKG